MRWCSGPMYTAPYRLRCWWRSYSQSGTPSRSPLFQVMFELQSTPLSVLQLPRLSLSPYEIDHGTAQFDLSLRCLDTSYGLVGALTYN